MTITMGVLISIASVAVAFIFSYATFKNREKKDNEHSGERNGVMLSELGYIKSGVDDLKREQRDITEKFQSQSERITRCEESCKQAHHRIDELNGGK